MDFFERKLVLWPCRFAKPIARFTPLVLSSNPFLQQLELCVMTSRDGQSHIQGRFSYPSPICAVIAAAIAHSEKIPATPMHGRCLRLKSMMFLSVEEDKGAKKHLCAWGTNPRLR